MSKKTTFGEQDDSLKDGDGGEAEEEAPLMGKLKRRHGESLLGKAWQRR